MRLVWKLLRRTRRYHQHDHYSRGVMRPCLSRRCVLYRATIHATEGNER